MTGHAAGQRARSGRLDGQEPSPNRFTLLSLQDATGADPERTSWPDYLAVDLVGVGVGEVVSVATGGATRSRPALIRLTDRRELMIGPSVASAVGRRHPTRSARVGAVVSVECRSVRAGVAGRTRARRSPPFVPHRRSERDDDGLPARVRFGALDPAVPVSETVGLAGVPKA